MCIWPEWYNSGLFHSVHQSDSLGEETVSVATGFSKQRSVAPAWRQQFEQFMSETWGKGRDVSAQVPNPWPVQVLVEGKISRDDPLCRSDFLLPSDLVLLHGWAKPDSDWCAQVRLDNDGIEVDEQLLWQVELPELLEDIRPPLGLPPNRNICERQFRSREKVDPRNLKWSTTGTLLFRKVRGRKVEGVGWGLSLKVHRHLYSFEHL